MEHDGKKAMITSPKREPPDDSQAFYDAVSDKWGKRLGIRPRRMSGGISLFMDLGDRPEITP